MSPQPRWRTTPSSSWEREMAMKMAPGAIPRPGRVPERSFCPPNLDFGAAAARNFSGSLVNIFRVYSAGAIYGRKGSSRRFPRRSRHTSARSDFNLGQPTCRASSGLIRTPIETNFLSKNNSRKFPATSAVKLFPFDIVLKPVRRYL